MEANIVRPSEVKTKTEQVPHDVRNLTRDGSMNPYPKLSVCCVCCACCSGACAFLLCFPFMAVAMVSKKYHGKTGTFAAFVSSRLGSWQLKGRNRSYGLIN